MLDRRQLLASTLAAPILIAARRSPLPIRDFAEVTRLAPGVYGTIAEPSRGLQCYSNGGVIAGRDAVLLVEGHFEPAGAELEVEVARAVSNAPIRGAIDTHYHLDHTFGNDGYARHGIAILAHERVGPLMRERYAAAKGAERAAVLGPWERRRDQAVDSVERERASGDLRQMTWFADAIESADIALPTESLPIAELPKKLDLGGLTAIIEFHPGHSPTDLVVRVPERDVIFTGDLLFNRAYPVTPDAEMRAWRNVLDVLAESDRGTRFVPGHGAIGGREVIRAQADLFDHLREHAERMMRAGASVEEAQSRYQVPSRYADYQMLSWSLTVGGAMRSFWTSPSDA